jgi:hypothetical protein
MDAVAWGKGVVIAPGRPGARPVVIVVGGAFRRGAGGPVAGRLTARVSAGHGDRRARGDGGGARCPAGQEARDFDALLERAGSVVLVVGAWPGGILAVGGPVTGRLAVGEPAVLVDDGGRPPRSDGPVARLAGLGPADRHGGAVDDCLTQAAGLPAPAAGNVFRREGEYWTVVFDGSVLRLKDTKGLRQLARLLADPGREFHAVDLEAAEGRAARAAAGPRERAAGADLAARPDLGDAGELLDATAKAAYKARLEDLRAELAEAERCHDPVRAARARAERDFLVAELARAVGLGGRDRRAACHAERARLNATRAIRTAMAHLARAHPALGQHLAATIRTGRYCSYTPDPRAPITWER